jgi:hypothetical protein
LPLRFRLLLIRNKLQMFTTSIFAEKEISIE